MSGVIAFPPRGAGLVLDVAMRAADAAALAEAAVIKSERRSIFGDPDAESRISMAALTAAAEILQQLTADYRMVNIVAHGMVQEALVRLRKTGVLTLRGDLR